MFLSPGFGGEPPRDGRAVVGVHVEAVESAVSAAGLGPVDAPLVELARVLALQMDAAGSAGPGTRLVGSYLTVVRTLAARAAAVRPASSSPASVVEPVGSVEPEEVPGGDVLDFRGRARRRRQAG